MLSDLAFSSPAEARVEEIKGGSVGVFELTHQIALAHTPSTSRRKAHGIP